MTTWSVVYTRTVIHFYIIDLLIIQYLSFSEMAGGHSVEAQMLYSLQRWEEMTTSQRDQEMTLPSSPLVSFEEMQRWAKASCKIILDPCSWGSGFFVVFRIHENQILYGVMTNNHVLDESRLEDDQNVELRLHNDETITVPLRGVGIRFTCSLLDVTFIELKEADVLKMDHHGAKFLTLCSSHQCTRPGTAIAVMQYPQNHSKLAFAQGNVNSLWGTCILHDVSTNHGSSGSGTVSMHTGEVVAIHCARRPEIKANVAVRAPVAIQAIKKVINANIAHHKPAKDLNPRELQELQTLGLHPTENKFLFISPASPFVTPLWFYRTNHAWYWTPTQPDSYYEIELRRCNWLEIGVGKSKSVIGGYWDGQMPASRNIVLIDKLAATGCYYLV